MENNELLQKIEKLENEMAEMKASRGLRAFLRRAFTRTSMVVGVAVAALLTGLILYAAQITFVDGTIISAADVNANFTELYNNVTQLFTSVNRLQATYRWNVFSSYDQYYGWMMGNNAAMFGGVNPSNWTDSNALAAHMSSDKEVLRTLFTQKGYAKKNAMIISDVSGFYPSSTNGKVVAVLVRIKNTTSGAIVWTPYFYYSCYYSWNEVASVALNGLTQWTSGGGNALTSTNISMSIPAGRTSTVIFISTSAQYTSAGGYLFTRALQFGFYNNSLQLPTGLEFVDDLDTATGGWEQ
jgi:hypothetical protein